MHRLRVATRRTRSALRTFRDQLPGVLDSGLRAELRALARALGKVRDLDVYRERYAAIRSALSVQDAAALSRHDRYLDAERQRAVTELAATLAVERCAGLLEDVAVAVVSVRTAEASGSTTTRRGARAYLERAKKGVLKRGARIDGHSPPERLHALRIRIKRFRYLLEFLSPLYEAARVEPALGAAMRAQDVLGEYQDACTAVGRLRDYAATAPTEGDFRAELIAVGELIAAEQDAARKARNRFLKEWPGIKKAVAALPIDD